MFFVIYEHVEYNEMGIILKSKITPVASQNEKHETVLPEKQHE